MGSDALLPLGPLIHVIQIGCHDEVLWINQVMPHGMLLPAGVITLVGYVALPSPRFKFPEIQPRLVVLEEEAGV